VSLKHYIHKQQPTEYLFKNSLKKAKLPLSSWVHNLRGSLATHLLEQGVYLRYIQTLLGHSSSKTPEIYTYVSKRSLENIKSPLDGFLGRNTLYDK
jgi:integrase/recombinase XerD